MATRQRPLSLWIACALILAAIALTTGRTVYDVYQMAKTRDDLAMSGIWADAVWCNVAIWVLLGLPLYGVLNGCRYCRFVVAAISMGLIALLLSLLRSGNHTLNPWMITILALQIVGSALLFARPSNAFSSLERA